MGWKCIFSMCSLLHRLTCLGKAGQAQDRAIKNISGSLFQLPSIACSMYEQKDWEETLKSLLNDLEHTWWEPRWQKVSMGTSPLWLVFFDQNFVSTYFTSWFNFNYKSSQKQKFETQVQVTDISLHAKVWTNHVWWHKPHTELFDLGMTSAVTCVCWIKSLSVLPASFFLLIFSSFVTPL